MLSLSLFRFQLASLSLDYSFQWQLETRNYFELLTRSSRENRIIREDRRTKELCEARSQLQFFSTVIEQCLRSENHWLVIGSIGNWNKIYLFINFLSNFPSSDRVRFDETKTCQLRLSRNYIREDLSRNLGRASRSYNTCSTSRMKLFPRRENLSDYAAK